MLVHNLLLILDTALLL